MFWPVAFSVSHTVLFLVGQTEIALVHTRYDGKDPGLKRIRSLIDRLVQRVEAV